MTKEQKAKEYAEKNWTPYDFYDTECNVCNKDIREDVEQAYIAGYHECQKKHEWHKADVPTNPINKVVLGYIKHYNSKLFCLVGWNGKWWYDANTFNKEVKLIAWKEITPPNIKEE